MSEPSNDPITPDRPDALVPRRRFLAASAAILVGARPASPSDLAPEPGRPMVTPHRRPGAQGQAARATLAEPGPMLPPVPAVLLTVRGDDGDPDHISVVWSFVVNGEPPQIGIAAGHEHVARELVGRHGEFVLNVPTAAMVQAFDTVDMSSSRVGDKFELSGLTPGRAARIDAPTVEESPVHVECRVFDRIEVPPSRTIFLADVVATTALDGACDEDGRLIVEAVPFFGMTAGSGEFYTMGERIGNIGMTVGRSDIKY